MSDTHSSSAPGSTVAHGGAGGPYGTYDIRYSRRRWGVLAILCVGVFMLLLDGTIVNIAIPDILTSFSTSFSAVEWVMNAYLLVFAVLLITTGRFGDLYGRKLLFMSGTALFTLASLACGLAPGIGWLIGFRAIQGLGGAMMMPNTLSIISNVFPPEERGKAMGFWGGVSGISLALGPSLGGLLVQASSWRWIFFINVPIGVILFATAIKYVPESTDPTSVKQIDYPGVATLTASLFCLTFALIEGQNYGWTSGLILGLFAACVVGFVVFVLIQQRQVQPLMELGLFKNRTYTVTNLVGLMLSFGMMGVFFLLPLFLQAILGYSAIKAGLVMTPLAAIVIVASPTSGILSDRIGPKWLMVVGMFITAFGFFLTRRVMVLDGSWPSMVLPFIVTGFGIGMVMPPMTSAVMGSVAPEKAGQASGVISSFRQIGSVLGIAVMGAVLQNRASVYIKNGIMARLDAAPFPIPTGAKQAIVDAVGAMSGNMGQLRTGGGFGVGMQMPDSVTKILDGLPDSFADKAVAFFKELFGIDYIMREFARGMRTAYFFSIILMVAGGLLALGVTGRVKKQRAERSPASGWESAPPTD
jgi:EmrB/QacA subfamily drug resistance transporter